jgi:hypothetical protein
MHNFAEVFWLEMKRLLVYLLSFVIVVVNAQYGLQIAVYEVFKPTIIEQFCINKDVPGSDCEAKCFMKDKLLEEKQSKKDPASPEHSISIKLIEADFRVTQISLPELIGTDLEHDYALVSTDLMDVARETPHAPPQV